MPKVVPLVFVSSTFKDLQEYRGLTAAVLDTEDLVWRGMERFVAQDPPPKEVIEERLQGCDLYIGILGHRYGSLVPDQEVSYTHFEYRLARDMGMQCLVFLADSGLAVEMDKVESDEQRARLERFKVEVNDKHCPTKFTPTNFGEVLRSSLRQWLSDWWERRAEDLALCIKPLESHEKEWIEQLYSRDASKVAKAVNNLGTNRAALEHYYALLRKGDAKIWAPICSALGRCDHFDDRIADIIHWMLHSQVTELRQIAVEAAGQRALLRGSGRVPESILWRVLELESDPDGAVRYEVAHALWRLTKDDGKHRSVCHQALMRLLGDPEASVRERANRSLKRLAWPKASSSGPPPQSQ